MPSHAGRWNVDRMMKLRMALDDFHGVLLVPICKGDHVNINVMGVVTPDDSNSEVPIVQLARTNMIKPENQARGVVRHDREGVFHLKSYDEDMLYGMAAILSCMGFAVYMPKLLSSPDKSGLRYRDKHRVEFLEFTPRVEYADAKIVSIDMRHALTFSTAMEQPDFSF